MAGPYEFGFCRGEHLNVKLFHLGIMAGQSRDQDMNSRKDGYHGCRVRPRPPRWPLGRESSH